MTTYNTGNPLGSTDTLDRYDNTENLDLLLNGPSVAYDDRLGVSRKSWSGFEADFAAFLAASGFEPDVLTYTDGVPLQVDRSTQLLERASDPGTIYSIKLPSSFPVVLSGTWATDLPLLVVRVDGSLRAELADPAFGSAIVAYEPGVTVQEKLDDLSFLAALSVHVQAPPFNAVGDGVADDTAAINAALTYAGANGVRVVQLGKTHLITGTLFVPCGVVLRGQGRGKNRIARLITTPGTYVGGWVVIVNSTDGVVWTESFPNNDAGGAEHIQFWNGDTAGTPTVATLRGAIGFGPCAFDNLRGRNMTKMVQRPGSGMYSDNFSVSDIYAEPVIGAEWQVDLAGLGDGAEIRKLHFPYNALNPGTGTPLGLRINGTYGGVVSACVGGDVFVGQSKVKFVGCHYERSQFQTDGANVDLDSCYFSAKDRIPVALLNTGAHTSSVSMKNCEFTHTSGLLDWAGNDVAIASNVTLQVDNCYRRFSRNSALDVSQLHGIRLQDAAGAAMTTWNKYSYELSRFGRVMRGNDVRTDISVAPGGNSFTGVTVIASEAGETWQAATATYFYSAQYLIDVDRLVGRNQTSAEVSLARTNGAAGARLTINYNKPANCMLRVFRGTAAGSYDAFVDLPIQSANLLYDNGVTLNGFPWIARAAGPVTVINSIGDTHYRLQGTRAILDAATIPTVGAWLLTDEIYRTAPAAAGKRAWVNIAAGSPGTFKAWGVIDA